MISGIPRQHIRDYFYESITVLDSRTIIEEARVGQESRHVQYVFNKFLELGHRLNTIRGLLADGKCLPVSRFRRRS